MSDRRTFRRTALLGAAAFVAGLVTVPSAAVAQGPPDCAPWCSGIGQPGQPGNPSNPGTPGTPAQPTGFAWYDIGLDRDEADELCWYPEFLGYRPTPPPNENSYAYVLGRIEEWTADEIGPTRCPGTEEAFDPAELALSFWLSADPPAAAPRIDPGRALAGLRTYLVIEGEPSLVLTDDTPLGQLRIAGEATYRIDWGDGSPATETASQGVPYPGGVGEITHAYTDAGEVTVTVTSLWSGTWTAGGASGELPLVTREASIPLPISERQAVRVD